jgi:multidrug efflux pump subunit AcrB
MAKYLLKEHDKESEEKKKKSRNPLVKGQQLFEHLFEKLRLGYQSVLELCIEHSAVFVVLFFVLCIGSFALLYPWLGQDFFPSSDSGQFKLHVRARTGTRIEETARLCDEVDTAIRRRDSEGRIDHHHRQHRPALQRPQFVL